MAHGTIIVDEERCKGCKLCTTACPQNVLVINEDKLNGQGYHPAMLLDPQGDCTGCAICVVICPDVCMTVYREIPVKHHAPVTA